MACSDLDKPEAVPVPVSPDWIRWIRLASARPARPCRDAPARPAPRLLPAFPGTGGAKSL
ncbi:hypothetical protein [Lichenibacterium ramalinae]|uniref:Uncharacterized protein n=1 Tax=Lichenibacterium ramalinae TaxID=2316527 RepID=A0A4Q2RC75_9HYPH|nr:hypothetical protein [Lichenibacterium ramalinae]RYB04647.1 hypothetical protein D3272_11900 [Lichenibacterium ramalinae]